MLEEALARFDGSVLVVSHDRYFLDRICDQIVAFEDNGRVVIQPGNYSYYLEKREQRAATGNVAPAPSMQAAASEPARPEPTRPRKLTYKEQRELEGMEASILAAESRVGELESLLNDPAFYATRAQEAAAMSDDLDKARAEVTRLYGRWEELDRIARGAS
jgi:ATP-binding cassette subfamily F protein uup